MPKLGNGLDTLRKTTVQTEYKRRVDAVLTTDAKADLLFAHAVGDLSPAQKAVVVQGWQWAKAMKAAGKTVYLQDLDETDDANWPDVPEQFVTLLATF